MTRKKGIWVWSTAALLLFVAAVIGYRALRKDSGSTIHPVRIQGAVLRKDVDPRKQAPISRALVVLTDGESKVTSRSDSAGYFDITLSPGVESGQPVSVQFAHAEYQPQELTIVPQNQLYVIRLEPLAGETSGAREQPSTTGKTITIQDVRVRYSTKDQTTASVGSIARRFEVPNKGNTTCRGQLPCSPDGRFKAAVGTLELDAQEGNEFRNVRVSCIAGPCPFTRVEPLEFSKAARTVKISALNWSDTASFLVEGEVTRTMTTDIVRTSYPFLMGRTMSFALPGAAEGPSIQADLDGQEIVFPLGPALFLSWATCSVEGAPTGNKIYRCELKPGYRFPEGA